MNLLDFIPVGAANAITTKELMRRSGISDKRTLQAEIHNLRERGFIICSQTEPPAGYFIAANPQEAARFVRSMESRQRQIERAIKAARKYCAE